MRRLAAMAALTLVLLATPFYDDGAGMRNDTPTGADYGELTVR